MNRIKYLLIFGMTHLLLACGGGGGGGNSGGNSGSDSDSNASNVSAPGATQSIATAEIVAKEDFDFRLGRDINIVINTPAQENGVVHIYSRAEAITSNGEVIPDPLSRVTTYVPRGNNPLGIHVNKTWQSLYFEWVPTTATGTQQISVLDLRGSNFQVSF